MFFFSHFKKNIYFFINMCVLARGIVAAADRREAVPSRREAAAQV
jgi:hypothetical protein